MKTIEFIVKRDDLATCEFIDTALPDGHDLPDDGLLLKIDRFAFTANNITYALIGEELKYWSLFPAPSGYGKIPVWGFAEVVQSRHPDVATGERLFGYFPMATHLMIEATAVTAKGLRDGAAHRQEVSPVYNAYARVTDDPAFSGHQGDQQALMRPLFMLSFLVDDYLAENDFFGARSVILSSASSKTAFGLAHLLHTLRKPVKVIGLTSRTNAAFVRSLGCYDDIVIYDDIAAMMNDTPAAYVDMAGSADLRTRLHHRFGDNLTYSGRVGLTHQDSTSEQDALPGAKPSWFFAPDQIRKRVREWGSGGLEQRISAVWPGLVQVLERSLTIVENRGKKAVERIYRDTLSGKTNPDQGHILSVAD
jgi:Protein of unknown function (DUF2855)